MKKTKLLFLTSSIIILLLASCATKEKCDCDKQMVATPSIPENTFTYTDEGRTPEMLNYTEIVTMLTNYDQTRIRPLEKALGYEDSRINNYNFQQFKKYLGYIEGLCKKSKIKITGISFIAASKPNYNNTGKSYQDFIYIPTTTINGKQIAFDPVQSKEQNRIVTFKEMLGLNGYKWIYDSKQDYAEGKNKNNNYKMTTSQEKNGIVAKLRSLFLSGAGNLGGLEPPYAR